MGKIIILNLLISFYINVSKFMKLIQAKILHLNILQIVILLLLINKKNELYYANYIMQKKIILLYFIINFFILIPCFSCFKFCFF